MCVILLLLTLLSGLGQPASSPDSLLMNVDNRKITSLNGDWPIIVDPFENGYYDYRYKPRADGYFMNAKPKDKSDLVEYNFVDTDVLHVPGDWNTQRPKLFFYEGTVWYKKSFKYDLKPGRRLFLYFGAANYEAHVYLNGKQLGMHTGGFTPFQFEITKALKQGENTLVVKVDNKRHKDGVPTLNTDWWNYGGLTRRVLLVETPSTFIRSYSVQLNPDNPKEIKGWVQLDGPNLKQEVALRIPEAKTKKSITTDTNGYGEFTVKANVKRWSPEHPKLYDVQLIEGQDTLHDDIGFRTIETKGTQILLNGKPIFLRGISIHEEAPMRGGRAYSREDDRTLLTWAKELDCNYVRLAHYPHNEAMLREADRMGLLVWSEIPVYWTVQFDNPYTHKLASQQLTEEITRDHNRASIIIWSVGNETPRSDARLKFLKGLIDQAHSMDPTRLVSAATEITYDKNTVHLDDRLGEYLDVIGANEYLGWYGGKPDNIPNHTWVSKYSKPLVISEFGAAAKYGYHADGQTRWSEEYQANVYRNQFKMLDKIPFLQGTTPWILMDFRSPRRELHGIQDFWNRKGLIDMHGDKKEAFYLLKDWYKGKGKSL